MDASISEEAIKNNILSGLTQKKKYRLPFIDDTTSRTKHVHSVHLLVPVGGQ